MSRGITVSDGVAVLEWTLGSFCFLALWLSLRGKTAERMLTVTEEGISTEIGTLKGQVPWEKIKSVEDSGSFVSIVASNGNAFFVPGRAFGSQDYKQQFLSEIRLWRERP
jgi:hypothetical protein